MNRLPLIAPVLTAALAAAAPMQAWADEAGADAEVERPGIVVNGQRADYRDNEADALRTGTPLIDTPQSVTTLSREQLDDQGAESLNVALRYVPGVTLGQGEGHRDQVVLRGQSSTADFFLDGLRDDAQYYRPLYNTERVEVLKGANALLFGRGGGGGIINRVSKVPHFGEAKASAAAALNSFGAWSLAADGETPLGESLALRLNSTYEEYANNRDVFGGNFLGLAPTLAARLGETGKLTLAYEFDRDRRVTDRGVPSLGGAPITGYEKTFFGSAALNQSRVDAHLLHAAYESELADGLTLNLAALYGTYDKYYGNLLAAGATASTVTLSGYDSTTQRDNWIGQASLVWKGEALGLKHTVLAGFDAGWQDTAATRHNAQFGAGLTSTTTVPLARTLTLPSVVWGPLATSSASKVRSISAYLQDQIELAPFLQVIAGARYDRFSIRADNRINAAQTAQVDGRWSPRLGLVIKPQANLSLYASFARSFLPQSGDQFATLDPTYLGLDPEAFRNLEAGVKWDVTPSLSLTAAAFEIERTNTRVADPANPGFWLQSGASRTHGFEAALSGSILPQWHVTLGYTWQQGKITSTTSAAPAGRKLDKLPEHQFSAWTRYDLTGKLGLGLGLVHQSSQFATISNAVRLPGFTRIDAALFYDLSERIAVQLNIENLTDTRYFASAHTDHNIQPGDPINARLSVKVKF